MTEEEAVSKFYYNLTNFQKTMETFSAEITANTQYRNYLERLEKNTDLTIAMDEIGRARLMTRSKLEQSNREKELLMEKAYEHFANMQSLLKAKVKAKPKSN